MVFWMTQNRIQLYNDSSLFLNENCKVHVSCEKYFNCQNEMSWNIHTLLMPFRPKNKGEQIVQDKIIFKKNNQKCSWPFLAMVPRIIIIRYV